MISICLIWGTATNRHSGWLYQSSEIHQAADTATLLSFRSHICSLLEEIRALRLSMTCGVSTWTRLLFLGPSWKPQERAHVWEYITQLLYARLEVLPVWWLFSEVELPIRALWRTLGVSDATETGVGIGLKLLISLAQRSPSLDTSIQLYSWAPWCSFWAVEPTT